MTYPFCTVTGERRGYNFRTSELKMDKCPLKEFPKDSVVLSEEEYADLKFTKNLLELREETIKYLEDANIRYAKELELKVNKKERKETAEKILERGRYCLPSGLKEWIIEQFGVEIKE